MRRTRPLIGFLPTEEGVPWTDKLRKVLFLAMLGMGGVLGATMNPKEIEDLMRIMNQTQIEVVVKEEKGDGDGVGIATSATKSRKAG